MNLKNILQDIKERNEKINTKVELLKYTRRQQEKEQPTDARKIIEFEIIIEGLENDIKQLNELNSESLEKLEQVIG